MISPKEKIGAHITNKTAQGALFIFFDIGEMALDAGLKLFHKDKHDDSKSEADSQNAASEPTDSPSPTQS